MAELTTEQAAGFQQADAQVLTTPAGESGNPIPKASMPGVEGAIIQAAPGSDYVPGVKSEAGVIGTVTMADLAKATAWLMTSTKDQPSADVLNTLKRVRLAAEAAEAARRSGKTPAQVEALFLTGFDFTGFAERNSAVTNLAK